MWAHTSRYTGKHSLSDTYTHTHTHAHAHAHTDIKLDIISVIQYFIEYGLQPFKCSPQFNHTLQSPYVRYEWCNRKTHAQKLLSELITSPLASNEMCAAPLEDRWSHYARPCPLNWLQQTAFHSPTAFSKSMVVSLSRTAQRPPLNCWRKAKTTSALYL